MDRYQHAPLRFASCRERERGRERVSRDKSQFEAVAKQEQSETILSSLRSVVVSGENCFSLSFSRGGNGVLSPGEEKGRRNSTSKVRQFREEME